MRVLGHIHTYNEGTVIDRSLRALREQSSAVEEVLLVDNASTDDTLDREFPSDVKVVRFDDNRLTSDPIIEAMRYAMDRGYDWVWVLNGDSAPRRDSLAKLLDFYEDLDPEVRDAVWLLAALPVDVTTGSEDQGFFVTPRGLKRARPTDDSPYECDAAIWSGSLYKVSAIREVGLPRSDYAMDIAEIEYGYRGRQRGYRAFVHPGATLEHNVDGPSLQMVPSRLGPFTLEWIELKPFRCYYVVRNVLHFWLYEYRSASPLTYLYCFLKVAKLTLSFALRPFSHGRQVAACARGFRDGLLAKLDFRYPV